MGLGFNQLKKSYKLFDFFYPIVVAIIIVQLLFLPGLRLGVITALIILIIASKNINRRIFLLNSSINKLVLLYLLYNSGSLVWFFFTGFPVSVFIAEWSNSILPILFFYFAYYEKKQSNFFYHITLITLVFSFILGFILWMWEPPFYRVFMDTTEGVGTDMLFFQSIFGLTATGALGVIGFLISSNIVLKSNGRKGKIALAICMVTIILTFRRSALLVLALAILSMHFIGYFRYKFIKKRYLLIEAIFLYYIFVLVSDNYGDFFTDLIERGSMISEAFNERSGTWSYAFSYGNLVIGDGLGAFGHKVIGYSKVLIADGNYFKMLAEIGIVGTSLFFAILIVSMMLGFKDLRNKYVELSIVLGLALMAIGSNIFTYQTLAPIFWYSIGRLSINYRQNEGMTMVDNEASILKPSTQM